MTRERACAVTDVADGGVTQVIVDGHPVAVVRIGEEVFAISDICSHQRISLSEGEVLCDTKELECWKHGSAFSLLTGEPSALPATKPVPVFPASIDGDDIYVEVP